MEFWGVEVKAGETLKVQPGDDKLLHLSQAALGETEKGKGADFSLVFLKFGDQKLVLGSLSINCPQLNFDLVFEKEFELSHNWKNGSVYFMGYKSLPDNGDEISDGSGDSSDEDVPLAPIENGRPEPQVAKATETVLKSKVKVVEPIKDEDDSDESDSDSDSDSDDLAEATEFVVKRDEDDSDESDESDSDPDDLAEATETVVKSKVKVVESINDEDDSDDSDESDSDDLDSDEDINGAEDDSEDEDEETPTPKKAVGNKKRPAESATKTPVPAKKAKATTPQKTDGKKGGHTATPHPAKKADKSKTPKVWQ